MDRPETRKWLYKAIMQHCVFSPVQLTIILYPGFGSIDVIHRSRFGKR